MLRRRMSKTRAIRFSEKDERLIQRFLKENSFLDFSTLARIAILKFIESPDLKVKGITSVKENMTEVRSGNA